MKIRKRTLSIAAAGLAYLTAPVQATTFSGTGADSWNLATNWDAGIPSGSADAVISSGAAANVNNSATPNYTGTLTLQSGATVAIPNNPAGGSENALLASGITLHAGSALSWTMNVNLSFPPISLAGNATLVTPFGQSDHQTDQFAAITGAHVLTINGFNNHTFNLNDANTFSALTCEASDRYNIRFKSAGAAGTGDVTVNQRGNQIDPNRSARLYFDVADVMADTATLNLNGPVGGGGFAGNGIDWVVINHGGDEKIAALNLYGSPLAPGTYTSAETWLGGSGTLTIEPVTPDNPAPAFGAIVPAGNVDLTWTNVSPNTGTDVWVDVWFGTDPGALAQVATGELNMILKTVSAPVADSYYWRVDSYLDGAPTGTPITGTIFNFEVIDTDGDGFPDDYELAHTNPPSSTALNVGDDADYDGSDGLTNWEEYQLGTDPTKSDTDGDTLKDGPELSGVGLRPATDPTKFDSDADGLHDGIESNTGTWASASDSGTDPIVPDTDADGLLDGVESNTDSFISEADTGTDPHDSDSDADGAGDWYEIAASHTDPNNAGEKPNIPYPLPDPDGSTGATDKPVKVYIMSGQSNMVGFGSVSGSGSSALTTMTRTEHKFPNLIDSEGNFIARQDVRYRGVISAIGNGPLAPGFGANGNSFGPELGFGQVMGWSHDEPVLLIKSSIGNRSLGWDVLPPGSPSYVYNNTNYAGYGDYGNWPVGGSPPTSGGWYAGKEFDRFFMDEADWIHADPADVNVVDILDNWVTEYSAAGKPFAGQDFEIAGFVWWQGDKDRYDMGLATRYEVNLVKLITSLRDYYTNRYPGKVVNNAPFVLATLGQTPLNSTNAAEKAILDAQLAVDGESGIYPQFAGNVKTVYSHPLSEGGASNGHYNLRAGTYMLVGDALGRAMVELQETATPDDYDIWAANYPGSDLSDPNGDFDGDGFTNDGERLFGTDPTDPAAINPISVPIDAAGNFSYTRRDPALSGLSYEVWTTTDLVTWTEDTGASQSPTSDTPVADVDTVAVTLSALPVDGKLFAQIRAGE